MKCHYTYDKKAGKVWIPGCYGGIYGPKGCTCRDYPDTFKQFEKQEYNKKVSQLNNEIKELQQYNAQLQRNIKKLIHDSKSSTLPSPT